MNLSGRHQHIPKDLEHICKRVHEKSESYRRYNFSQRYSDFLKAFFDLAQEFDSLEDFYRVIVSVPLEMIGVESVLYLYSEKDEELQKICSSTEGLHQQFIKAAYPVQLSIAPYELEGSYVIPILSKEKTGFTKEKNEKTDTGRQTKLWENLKSPGKEGYLLGMYQVLKADNLSDADKFFFVKYSNRVGYNLANRLLANQNIEHLKFINSLIIDIEHNVIVPNMYFKHLYKQLNKKLEELSSIHDQLDVSIAKDDGDQSMRASQLKLKRIMKELNVYHQEIVKHHSSTSLFLESLFRREHFEQGEFVLHPKRCLIEQEVIKPQLENYSSRLKAAGILVETPPDMLEEEVTILADVGLLAQVYANFFSNAAKYTKEVTTPSGEKRKVMAYGREIIENFPSQGYRSIKFNVFTTGPSLAVEQGNSLFQEGMRGEGLKNEPGMGHGLSFVRQVIEMHGGVVGYEPTSGGNNFYFILPAPRPEYQPLLLTHD